MRRSSQAVSEMPDVAGEIGRTQRTRHCRQEWCLRIRQTRYASLCDTRPTHAQPAKAVLLLMGALLGGLIASDLASFRRKLGSTADQTATGKVG